MTTANEPGSHRSLWVLGDLYTYKVSAEESAGAFCMMEVKVHPGNGVPPHIHRAESETFYVLEGEIEFVCGERTVAATAGSCVHVPLGTPHSFRNAGERPGRFLVLLQPAGFEQMFEAIGEVANEGDSPPPVDPATIDKLMELAPQHNLEILPPPG